MNSHAGEGPGEAIARVHSRHLFPLGSQGLDGMNLLAGARIRVRCAGNCAVPDAALYFRTAPGSELLDLTVDPSVAFEIDGYDSVSRRV